MAIRSKLLKMSTLSPSSHHFYALPVVMTREKIECKKVVTLRTKIDAEDGDYLPDNFIERCYSNDVDVLKGLFNDYKRINRSTTTKKENFYVDDEIDQLDGDYFSGDLLERYHSTTTTTKKENSQVLSAKYWRNVEREFDAEAKKIVEMGSRIVGMSDLNLEFLKVVKAYQDPFPLDRQILIKACILDALRVPIFIQAKYFIFDNEVHYSHIVPSVPFMKVMRKDKKKNKGKSSVDMEEKAPDCKPLLYANIKNCPTMDKRLGLNKKVLKHKLNSWVRGKVSKVAKDDELLPSLAKLAVQEQNQIGNQQARLRFVKVEGDAWVETISKHTLIYHIMLLASVAGMEKVFYAAVMGHRRCRLYTIVDWAAASASHNVTMPLP